MDPDVHLLGRDAVRLATRATEMFVQWLGQRSVMIMQQEKYRQLKPEHIGLL